MSCDSKGYNSCESTPLLAAFAKHTKPAALAISARWSKDNDDGGNSQPLS
jgi:hypothetical protein